MRWAKKRVIKASEISQYVFCPRAWWWREIEGIEPEDAERLAQGTQFHRRYSGRVILLERLWILAWALLAVALCLLILGIMLLAEGRL